MWEPGWERERAKWKCKVYTCSYKWEKGARLRVGRENGEHEKLDLIVSRRVWLNGRWRYVFCGNCVSVSLALSLSLFFFRLVSLTQVSACVCLLVWVKRHLMLWLGFGVEWRVICTTLQRQTNTNTHPHTLIDIIRAAFKCRWKRLWHNCARAQVTL